MRFGFCTSETLSPRFPWSGRDALCFFTSFVCLLLPPAAVHSFVTIASAFLRKNGALPQNLNISRQTGNQVCLKKLKIVFLERKRSKAFMPSLTFVKDKNITYSAGINITARRAISLLRSKNITIII